MPHQLVEGLRRFRREYGVEVEYTTFYNLEGNGCLGARLSLRTADGVRLYERVYRPVV